MTGFAPVSVLDSKLTLRAYLVKTSNLWIYLWLNLRGASCFYDAILSSTGKRKMTCRHTVASCKSSSEA